jgi:hypothetical protein
VVAAESPELLALGAELDVKIDAYRAAAVRLTEARAVAAQLWPAVPAELVVGFDRADRDFYSGCHEEETDFEGKEVWPEPYQEDGKWFSYPPRKILRSEALALFLADVRGAPDCYEDWVLVRLVERTDAATRFEVACDDARRTSGIEQAKQDAERAADDLCDIAWSVRAHIPRTVTGVLIHARALAGYADAEHDGFMKAPGQAATILGRGLADAVLQIGGLAS